jgi:pilus assembly protein CpaB
MKIKGLPVVLALMLAVAATGAVYLYVHGVQHASTSPGSLTVIVSKQDIPAGSRLDTLINQGDFTSLPVPRNAVVAGAVTDLSQLKGRTTSSFIIQGEQITTARLQGSAQPTGGVLGIPGGDQAMTLALESERAVNGAIQGGDHVVVYGTFTSQGKGGAETLTLVSDVQVLRVANTSAGSTSSGGQGTQLITLALSPQDAGRVVLAQEKGSVWLALLPPSGHGVAQSPVTMGGISQ